MDVVKAASTLRDQMIVLDVAQKQKELLDDQIGSLSQQSLVSSLDGNTARCLQLSIRLSVCEGVQHIYQQVKDEKWKQIQTTAQSILSESQNTEPTSPVTTSPPSVAMTTDKTVAMWSTQFCDFYRDN